MATFDAEITPCGPISFGTFDWGDGGTATATISGIVDPDCLRGPCVEGPIVFGDIAWDDGSTDRVSELSGEPASITHEYESSGLYSVTFTSTESGESLSEAILIR